MMVEHVMISIISALFTNILIPKVGVLRDKFFHHLNTIAVMKYRHVHTSLLEQSFVTQECFVFADNNAWDSIQ